MLFHANKMKNDSKWKINGMKNAKRNNTITFFLSLSATLRALILATLNLKMPLTGYWHAHLGFWVLVLLRTPFALTPLLV